MRHSQYKRIRNILIELFGTMAIVYFTNWANLLYELEQVGLSTLAMIYGMMVASMIDIGQDRSGGHFDPSVTVGELCLLESPWRVGLAQRKDVG